MHSAHTHRDRATSDLRAILQQVIDRTGVPGISAAVLRDGHVTCAAAGLRATSTPAAMCVESRFAMGSTAKFLVGAAAVELIASKRLAPDAPLHTYFPELAGCEMGDTVDPSQLLSHTTGCHQQAEGFHDGAVRVNGAWAGFVQRLTEGRRLFPSGAVFNYDNSNYVLSCELLGRLHGGEPRELIRASILAPLGIDCGAPDSDTETPGRYVECHMPNADGTLEPAAWAGSPEERDASLSCMTLSMPDLVSIAASIMGARNEAGTILSPAAREMLLSELIDLPIAPEWLHKDSAIISYGFGCAGYGNGMLGHAGILSGQCCALHFDSTKNIALAVGINALAPQIRDATLSTLLRSIGHAPQGTRPTWLRPTFDRDELVGHYVGGTRGLLLEVRAHESALICRLATQNGEAGNAGSGKSFQMARFHLTDEGHAVLEEQSRHVHMCFFREPGSRIPCLRVGTRAYRHI